MARNRSCVQKRAWWAWSAAFLVLAIVTTASDVSVLDMYRKARWSDALLACTEVHGPGILVDGLPLSNDKVFEANVQEVLDSYRYDRPYIADVFDCTNTSQITWMVLKERGFDARLLYCCPDVAKNGFEVAHVWVVVPRNGYQSRYGSEDYESWVTFGSGGWIQVESTWSIDKNGNSANLGKALAADEADWAYSKGVGWMFNSTGEFELMIGEDIDTGIEMDMAKLPIVKVNSSKRLSL